MVAGEVVASKRRVSGEGNTSRGSDLRVLRRGGEEGDGIEEKGRGENDQNAFRGLGESRYFTWLAIRDK